MKKEIKEFTLGEGQNNDLNGRLHGVQKIQFGKISKLTIAYAREIFIITDHGTITLDVFSDNEKALQPRKSRSKFPSLNK